MKRRLLTKIGGGFGGLVLILTLTACSAEAEATFTARHLGTTTPTTIGAPTATPRNGPGFNRPSGTPVFQRPTGTIFVRPTGTPDLPFDRDRPTVTPSANGVAPASDDSCPGTHPIKATQVGPLKTYFLSDHPAYDRTPASECFATEADADAAGYRKARN